MSNLTEERLTPDCSKCRALCCVALEFDWPHYKKPPGEPCKNLTEDFKCSIFDRLEEEGCSECRSHNCYGAGQNIAQAVEGATGCSWRDGAHIKNVEFSEYLKLFADIHEKLTGRPAPRKEKAPREAVSEQPATST